MRYVQATIGLLVILGLTGCYGPTPVVTRQELQPPQTPDGPYTLVITLQNQSGGEGQAQVIARLRSKASGETAAEGDQTVDLKPRETTQVLLQLQPPAPGDYDATVEAQYPPE